MSQLNTKPLEGGCRTCKALRNTANGCICRLGHPINKETRSPVEDCPRPLTYLSLNEYLEDRKSDSK